MASLELYDELFTLIIGQHAHLHTLAGDVERHHGQERAASLDLLRAQLAAHEAAEQKWVHPMVAGLLAKGVGHPGDVDLRLVEERDAGIALDRMMDMDPESSTYGVQLALFSEALQHHAEAEEGRELPLLRDHPGLDDELKVAIRAAQTVPAVAHELRHVVGQQGFLDSLDAAGTMLEERVSG